MNFLNSSKRAECFLSAFSEETKPGNFVSCAQRGLGVLQGYLKDLEEGWSVEAYKESLSPEVVLRNIADKFHAVARQLRARHAKRSTLDISDEYDCQDLLHALLRLHFDDIRPEEWTPSYAGKSSRMDFLLKKEKVVIEVKMTRDGLGEREIGSQLIDDIARYKTHPDCKLLVCFVYDPQGKVGNPRGVENDLRRDEESLPVQVWIRP